jgi:hypothetical protein
MFYKSRIFWRKKSILVHVLVKMHSLKKMDNPYFRYDKNLEIKKSIDQKNPTFRGIRIQESICKNPYFRYSRRIFKKSIKLKDDI